MPTSPQRPVNSPPIERWFQFLDTQHARAIALPITILFALLIRWCVGLYGYSGYGTPPLYGDYEAQRHWMEITVHLPPSRWYFYDLQYWGLDYPPLTAYQSWLCGMVAHYIDPSWVALDTSRGLETNKLFMRASAIVLEFLIYVPAVIMLVRLKTSWIAQQTAIFAILLQPCLILVDHGHFQYNSVMLGFLVWSVYFAAREHYIAMAMAFCCSFMFKQMSLYYSPAIFAFLLAKCFYPTNSPRLFINLAITVIATISVILLPWIFSLEQLQQIAIRVFPVARGLYEDKVANVWCAINVVVKLRSLFHTLTLVRLATGATLLACLPACAHLFYALKRTTVANATLLKYCLVNTSLAFFLFSFQVHEKTILVPLTPALLLIHEEKQAVHWMVQVALFSIYPLLLVDGQAISYWVLAIGWFMLECPAHKGVLQWIATVAMAIIHILQALVPPPAVLPDIYKVLNVTYSCALFVGFYGYFNYRQFTYLQKQPTASKSKTE
ncbi:Glucosyltransferase-like protein [Coemansia sp. RSA 1086]|nr:Glucosyltransferase-like protein [Coemansia sp. RSA 1086]